ncbi:hypothetical protein [Kamptonema sp. UHCC 0994]|uniref:hypothetical protein n=1 Tax=Kamptonema sp. UHCC 0994 TaxID=3031329 RepID=UPI0023B8F123|nr:hypothetical protein [Kamptonema sp. UHCC 0994]MDF0555112.1 hypothetical protein [Kamptonema sp. UHCC 0994]
MGISSSFSNSNFNFLDAIPTSAAYFIKIPEIGTRSPHSLKKQDWKTRSPQSCPAGISSKVLDLSNHQLLIT